MGGANGPYFGALGHTPGGGGAVRKCLAMGANSPTPLQEVEGGQPPKKTSFGTEGRTELGKKNGKRWPHGRSPTPRSVLGKGSPLGGEKYGLGTSPEPKPHSVMERETSMARIIWDRVQRCDSLLEWHRREEWPLEVHSERSAV